MPSDPVVPPRDIGGIEELVRALVREQAPEGIRRQAERRTAIVAYGWDNVIVRLGHAYAARLPLHERAAALLDREIRWSAGVASPLRDLGIAFPQIVFAGSPQGQCRWPWAVVTWCDGTPMDGIPVARRRALSGQLGEALAAIHRPAPCDLPGGMFRGVPLADRAASVEARWPVLAARSSPDVVDLLRRAWETGLAAQVWSAPLRCTHGDPHPGNLLQLRGRLGAVIDFGDLAAGDPAVDLAAGWLVFDAPGRDRFLETVLQSGSYDPAILTRARAWAASMAAAMFADGDPTTQPTAWHVVVEIGRS